MKGTCSDTGNPTPKSIPPADPFNIQIEYKVVDIDEELAELDRRGIHYNEEYREALVELYGETPVPFTPACIEAIERAARRWEEVAAVGFADTLFREPFVRFPDREPYVQIDDFLLTVSAGSLDYYSAGFGGHQPHHERPHSEVPFAGQVTLFRRVDDIGSEYMYQLTLHEIGHALGLVQMGRGSDGDYWQRPAFVRRFGVTQGVFTLISAHFNVGGDIMGDIWNSDITTLSAAVMDDMGYHVDYEAEAEFVLSSGKPTLHALPALRCGVGHSYNP